ncbi:MAG: AAA family ATPase, partial [Bacteroidota bacterium]
FETWFQVSRPDVIMVDDIHGLHKSSGVAHMLNCLEYVNTTIGPDTILIGTANQIEKVELALRRPGRFDSPFFFTSEGYQKEIFEHYRDKYKVEISDSLSSWVLKRCKDLTGAYIKEVCKTLCSLDFETEAEAKEFLTERLELMVKLATKDHDHQMAQTKKEKPAGFLADRNG